MDPTAPVRRAARPRRLTRREGLALLGAAAALPLVPRAARAAPLAALALFGPPATPSVPLAHAVGAGLLADLAEAPSFHAWRTPDELRAGLASGAIGVSVVPVQVAANLHGRGFPIRLATVATEGLLWVVAERPGIAAVADLAGLRLAVPFRGDTPEIVLGQLLAQEGLEPGRDLEVTYAATPVEAMQLLLAGRVDAALAAEPSATAAVLRGAEAGRAVRRAIDVQEAWGAMTGGPPVLPQAGLAVTDAFREAHGHRLGPLLAALARALEETLAEPERAAAHAADAMGLPAAVIAASVPHSRLVARPAREARPEIEAMLAAMAGPDLARVGGRMPGDGFYL